MKSKRRTKSMKLKKLKRSTKRSTKRSKKRSISLKNRKLLTPKLKIESCEMISTKKYSSRPGPPYPAQNCKYNLKYGNDGILYQSKPDKNNRFRWVKI